MILPSISRKRLSGSPGCAVEPVSNPNQKGGENEMMKKMKAKMKPGSTVANSNLAKRDPKNKRTGRGANRTGKVNKLH